MEIIQHPWPDPFQPPITIDYPPLQLESSFSFDTRSSEDDSGSNKRSKSRTREFFPGESLRLYVCGITPYDATHLGHAATYLTFDLINRYLRASGSEVNFVENITDIDEPLLERAQRDGVSWEGLAQEETELFMQDMTALRIFAPRWFVPATQVMELVDQAITQMKSKGYVYSVENDLYFRVNDFLINLPISEAEAIEIFSQRGGDPHRMGKEHPLDPVLWLANKENEPGWESSHGFGRPGWHIECAVISLRYLLGPTFIEGDRTRETLIDIQGGGSDLIFPHHFMSAAQVTSITNQNFAHAYVHTGMIGLDGEKMSKSKGNLVFVSQSLKDGIDPMVIRYALMKSHYSTDRMWDQSLLNQATVEIARIRSVLARIEVAPSSSLVHTIIQSLSLNLDTPGAIGAINEWVIASENGETGGSVGEVARALDSLLGLAL